MCPIASVMESENQLAANMFTTNQEIRMRDGCRLKLATPIYPQDSIH